MIGSGDNIFGFDTTDPTRSMNAAFAPAVSLNIPWAAVLGNHDQESTLSRKGVMKFIVGMKNTLAQLNPPGFLDIDGYGNYNLEVHGFKDSNLANKSVLNLYFLDSGDYSKVPSIPGYDWIKPSQQLWFQHISTKLQVVLNLQCLFLMLKWLSFGVKFIYYLSSFFPMQRTYKSKPMAQKTAAPGLAYFHIPLPEYASFDSSNFTGVKQEGISSASVNSGMFATMVESGDVKAVFTGHDHINDFCGELSGVHLCYGGGFGYHAYGKAGWQRRARMVVSSLEKTDEGVWGAVKSIKTWKRLDDHYLTPIDAQVLFSKNPTGKHFS